MVIYIIDSLRAAGQTHVDYHEKASSIKWMFAICCFARTTARTSSLSEPLPHTLTAMAPILFSISMFSRVLKFAVSAPNG